jgi:Flp pilus assembly pilin Flp
MRHLRNITVLNNCSKTYWNKPTFFKPRQILQSLIRIEEGQDLVEYALLIALLSLGLVASGSSVASALNTQFSRIAATIT